MRRRGRFESLMPRPRSGLPQPIELLQDNPRPPAAKKLIIGGGEYRIRTGDCRIIYEINDDALVILVFRAGHRREIYR